MSFVCAMLNEWTVSTYRSLSKAFSNVSCLFCSNKGLADANKLSIHSWVCCIVPCSPFSIWLECDNVNNYMKHRRDTCIVTRIFEGDLNSVSFEKRHRCRALQRWGRSYLEIMYTERLFSQNIFQFPGIESRRRCHGCWGSVSSGTKEPLQFPLDVFSGPESPSWFHRPSCSCGAVASSSDAARESQPHDNSVNQKIP